MTKLSEPASHQLRSLEIIGGFLDGETFDLSNGLNCIIGARGTGKTTVLEFVRYAMDAMPSDKDACKRITNLMEQNLQGGRIKLHVKTKAGLSYIISRSAGEDPIVLSEDGHPTEISLKSGGLFNVDIYSQNEVENIADEAMSQLKLLDNFEATKIAEIEHQIQTLKADLAANASAINPLQNKLDVFGDELATLPSVEAKLKAYKDEGGEDSDAINKAHSLKALRDREANAIKTAKELINTTGQELSDAVGRIAARLETLASEDVLKGPNSKLMTQMFDSLWACGIEIDNHLNTTLEKLRSERDQLNAGASKLHMAHDEQELEFRKLIEKHKETQGKATERSQLEKRRNQLLAMKRDKDDLTSKIINFREGRTVLLNRLSELRDKRFAIREQIADKINNSLGTSIRVSVTQFGNPEKYRVLLEDGLKNAGLRRNIVAGKLINAFWPSELNDYVQKKDVDPFVEKAELSAEQAQKVITALADSGILYELETVELVDLPKIELNDHDTYKTTESLSTGQKCNTILPILLLDRDNPLLIDQPEDNLDNRFVHDTIVESVLKVKKNRQLIFVTHNPNIPVLGDADKVFVLESNGTSAQIKNAGNVDDCKDDIVTLLEGGEDAFMKRQARYSF